MHNTGFVVFGGMVKDNNTLRVSNELWLYIARNLLTLVKLDLNTLPLTLTCYNKGESRWEECRVRNHLIEEKGLQGRTRHSAVFLGPEDHPKVNLPYRLVL